MNTWYPYPPFHTYYNVPLCFLVDMQNYWVNRITNTFKQFLRQAKIDVFLYVTTGTHIPGALSVAPFLPCGDRGDRGGSFIQTVVKHLSCDLCGDLILVLVQEWRHWGTSSPGTLFLQHGITRTYPAWFVQAFKPMKFYFKVLTTKEACTYYITYTQIYSSLNSWQN